MELSLNIKITPSAWFIGVLAELNGKYSGWSDGSYDWADQTTDFLADLPALPGFDPSLFKTPLSQKALNDVIQVVLAMIRGDYGFIRSYLKDLDFVFIIGYPRTGGSYLTKSIIKTTGLDHKYVPEPLAHDSFPNIMDSWHENESRPPSSYLYESFVQLAELFVLCKLYYPMKTKAGPQGLWLVPKKIHKAVHAGHGFKMLFNQLQAKYLLTFRNPLPIAISVFEKSGGLPANGLFPAHNQRSAIESMITHDLLMEGYSIDDVARLDYYTAVEKSWVRFYSKMATSGLFSNNKSGVDIVSYNKDSLQNIVRSYQAERQISDTPEEFYINNKSEAYPAWKQQAALTLQTMKMHWKSLGLTFPDLDFS